MSEQLQIREIPHEDIKEVWRSVTKKDSMPQIKVYVAKNQEVLREAYQAKHGYAPKPQLTKFIHHNADKTIEIYVTRFCVRGVLKFINQIPDNQLQWGNSFVF
jgi:hypothetical protein